VRVGCNINMDALQICARVRMAGRATPGICPRRAGVSEAAPKTPHTQHLRNELCRQVALADVRVVVREVVARRAKGAHPHPRPVVDLPGTQHRSRPRRQRRSPRALASPAQAHPATRCSGRRTHLARRVENGAAWSPAEDGLVRQRGRPVDDLLEGRVVAA